jgi:hypothetical protein
VQDFRIVVGVTDSNAQEAVCGVLRNNNLEEKSKIVVAEIDSNEPYNSNFMRNLALKNSRRSWCIVLDIDISCAPNFVEEVFKHIKATHGSQRIVYTFPHCNCLAQPQDFTEFLKQAKEFVEWARMRYCSVSTRLDTYPWFTNLVDRGHSSFFAKQVKRGYFSGFWDHPLIAIRGRYYPSEFYFVAHWSLLSAMGFFDEEFSGRGCSKMAFNLLLYYLSDLQFIFLETIVNTFVVHIEHSRSRIIPFYSSEKKHLRLNSRVLKQLVIHKRRHWKAIQGFLDWQLNKNLGS